MIRSKLLAVVFLPVILGGCTTTATNLAEPNAGFKTVAEKVGLASGKQTVWVQSRQQALAATEKVRVLLGRTKTLDVETAVQVALLNNKGLQAAYAELGVTGANAWQATMFVNPSISFGLTGVGTPGFEAFKTIEGAVVSNILALATHDRKVAIADARFRQSQLMAAVKTLTLAAETRRAWIKSVAAFESVSQLQRAQSAADAASELAQRLGETGAMSKGSQAREHVFVAELAGQTAKARLAARLSKEELTRLMGLWDSDLQYRIPDRLPALPKTTQKRETIEVQAMANRVDLQAAKVDLEANAKSYGLTDATRYVTDLEILTGFETERSVEDGKKRKETTVAAEVGFSIPIFDSGKARLRKAELAYMRSANELAEKAVNVRSEARSAYEAYRSSYAIARHYRDSVVPLRSKVEAESLLAYNGMISNTFELLTDSRDKINSIQLSVDAKRDFWLAEASLVPAIYGGGSSPTTDQPDTSAASSDAGSGE